MKRAFILLGIAAFAVAGTWFLWVRNKKQSLPVYTFVQLSRGGLDNSISSSGTLNAVKSVDVGTQVSGKIDRLLVDFNDMVTRGQVLAVLDTTVLATAVLDSRTGIDKAQAAYDAAKNNYDRNKVMFENKYISEFELISLRTSMEAARADLESAKLSLERARTNLGYAVIRSPISGKIIYKTVQEGQTVASSFSTPTLFTIAQDLSKMQIYALVDESDIGKITKGQKATFTVEAYLDKTFTGTVSQIRLQPETVQNVVNYTVVVDAPNTDNLLLPGMTATVTFLAEGAPNMLLVPNIALQFQPPPQILQEFQKQFAAQRNQHTDSTRAGRQGNPNMGSAGSGSSGQPAARKASNKNRAKLWYLDDTGKLAVKMVRIGETDGRLTVIPEGQNIREGMQVISGVVSQKPSAAAGPAGGLGRRMF